MKRLPEDDYVALGRTILHGEKLPEKLVEPLVGLGNGIQTLMMEAGTSDSRAAFLSLLLPLSMWYQVLENIKAGRLAQDAPEVKAAEAAMQTFATIVLPHLARALAVGHAETFSQVGAVIEAARSIPPLGNLAEQKWVMARLSRGLGFKGRKMQKRTARLLSLLPVWLLGMGRLTYVEKCEVLERVGIGEAEIPEDEALRQLLSYHGVPRLVTYLEDLSKLASKGAPSKTE